MKSSILIAGVLFVLIFSCYPAMAQYEAWLEMAQNTLWPGEDIVFDVNFHNGSDEPLSHTFPTTQMDTYFLDNWNSNYLMYFQVLCPVTIDPGETWTINHTHTEPAPLIGDHLLWARVLSHNTSLHEFTVTEPTRMLSTLFLNFEDAEEGADGSFYSNFGVKFYAGYHIANDCFEGESPVQDPDYVLWGKSGFKRPPSPGKYLTQFSNIKLYEPAFAVSFMVYASQPGDIIIRTDRTVEQTLTANEAGWYGPCYLTGNGAISSISFSGAAFGGIDNFMACFTRLPGDCNNDGVVNLDDFIILKKQFGWQVDQLPSVTLESVRDLNNDGVVNLDDYIIFKQTLPLPQTAYYYMEKGDFNADGIVNLDDFVILKQNYGTAGE